MTKHAHPGPHLSVALTQLELRSDTETKAPQKVLEPAGSVAWTPGGFSHTVTNVGKSAARWVVWLMTPTLR